MAFWQNRIARVWPVHIATLHIDLVTSLATGRMGITEGGHRRTLTAYLQNLAMVQNWFNDRPQLQRAGLVDRQRMVRLPLRARPLHRHRRHPAGPRRGAARRARVCRGLLVFAAKALPNGNVEHMFYVRIGGEFVGGATLCLAWIRGGLRLDRLVWPLAIGLLAVIWLVPDTHSPGYWLAPGFGLFVAAWLLHVAVERPCRDLLRARRS